MLIHLVLISPEQAAGADGRSQTNIEKLHAKSSPVVYKTADQQFKLLPTLQVALTD